MEMAGLWRDRVRGGRATRKKAIAGRANEDSALCRPAEGMVGVFDGIGMYAQARLASVVARQRCIPGLRAIDFAHFATLDDALMAVSRAVLNAQAGVVEIQREYPQAGEGGTTATLVKLWQANPDGPTSALFANIGDSRLFLWRPHGKRLMRLTSDDNVVRQWHDVGWIDEPTADQLTDLIDGFDGSEPLPPAAREAWEQRNTISAWLGMPEISFSLGAVTLHPGDRLIATTDGIHDNLTTDTIAAIVGRKGATPREVALSLVDVADAIADVDASPRAKPDDMTAVALFFDR
jgi:serine/threonine protein phosphatase PrpC